MAQPNLIPFPQPAPPVEQLLAAEADLALALEAIQLARTEYAAAGGHRTAAADVAEIRAGRFLAQHGDVVLKAIAASKRPMYR